MTSRGVLPTKKEIHQENKIEKKVITCNKCGSVMIKRRIVAKNGSNNGRVKLIEILQCKTCRHWRPLN